DKRDMETQGAEPPQAEAESRCPSREDVQSFFKPISLKCFVPLAVVVGIVGVEPIAAPVYVEVCNLGEFRRLQQKLLFRNQRSDEVQLGFVQVELTPVQLLVHIRVGKKHLGGATFDDHVKELRAFELIE